MKLFKKHVGIDLGTANTLVYVGGKGIVIREPSVVAINETNNNVLAVGEEAKQMIGRTPGNIVAVQPVREGVIADFDATKLMIKEFIRRASKQGLFFRNQVVICVPSGVTEVERKAVEEATFFSGVKNVYIVEEPKAAALGAGLPVDEPVGSMIVDIGGGTTEVAVLSLGGIVTSKSLRTAGNAFDNVIINYIKKEFNLIIGERTAEELKIKIASAYPKVKEAKLTVKGRDIISGFPRSITVTSENIREALQDVLILIVDAIKSTLEKTPPELAADIIESGIYLAGGGALLSGLDKFIHSHTGVRVEVSEEPLDCVVKGTGIIVDDFENVKRAYTKVANGMRY